VEWEPGEEHSRPLVLRIEGAGFLRHMVRTIAGTMVEIGAGRSAPSRMVEILASGDRGQAGPTAPPAGLFLVRVNY
jgi:tRNA pseudouridine38-40 synthase